MRNRPALTLVQWIVLAAVVVAVGVGAVLTLAFTRPSVIVTEVVEGPAVQAFYATGTLEPADREHPLGAGVSGFLQKPDDTTSYISKGDRVYKDQVLAVIFDEGTQRAYDKAAADRVEKLARANPETSPILQAIDANITAYKDLVDASQREYNRYEAGMKAGAANQSDFDRALFQLKDYWSKLEGFKAQRVEMQLQLDRQLAEAESAFRTATWNREKMKVRSPIDGYVIDQPQQPGAKLNVNDRVVTVANTAVSNLVMRAQVDEEDVTKVWQVGRMDRLRDSLRSLFDVGRVFTVIVEPKQTVRMTLYAFADQSFTGHVVRIYQKADPERRTFEVDVVLDAPSQRMQHGMTGELAFEMASKPKTLVIPSQAVQDGKIWAVRGGKLTATDADIGLTGVERVEVVRGLKAGDQIVISPIGGVEPNTNVMVGQVMDPATAAGLNKPKKKEVFRGGF